MTEAKDRPRQARPKKQHNPIISFRIAPALLARLDAYREPLGLTRTTAIALALDKGLHQLNK